MAALVRFADLRFLFHASSDCDIHPATSVMVWMLAFTTNAGNLAPAYRAGAFGVPSGWQHL
jgi:hypothetical protein|tara:strand:- start:29 stop:211 length:183 start_codon:yes stop_codon:yes gene_type:complete